MKKYWYVVDGKLYSGNCHGFVVVKDECKGIIEYLGMMELIDVSELYTTKKKAKEWNEA